MNDEKILKLINATYNDPENDLDFNELSNIISKLLNNEIDTDYLFELIEIQNDTLYNKDVKIEYISSLMSYLSSYKNNKEIKNSNLVYTETQLLFFPVLSTKNLKMDDVPIEYFEKMIEYEGSMKIFNNFYDVDEMMLLPYSSINKMTNKLHLAQINNELDNMLVEVEYDLLDEINIEISKIEPELEEDEIQGIYLYLVPIVLFNNSNKEIVEYCLNVDLEKNIEKISDILNSNMFIGYPMHSYDAINMTFKMLNIITFSDKIDRLENEIKKNNIDRNNISLSIYLKEDESSYIIEAYHKNKLFEEFEFLLAGINKSAEDSMLEEVKQMLKERNFTNIIQ